MPTTEKTKFLFQISVILVNFLLTLISVWLIAEINYYHDQYRLNNRDLQQILQFIQPQLDADRFRDKSKLEQNKNVC